MSKLKIITTRTKDGNFDKNKESFPNLTEEEIELLYNSNLEKLDIDRKNTVIINENNQEEGYLILKKGKKKTETNKEAVVIKDSLTDFFVLAETNDYPVIIGTVKKDDEETAIIALATLNNLKNESGNSGNLVLSKEQLVQMASTDGFLSISFTGSSTS